MECFLGAQDQYQLMSAEASRATSYQLWRCSLIMYICTTKAIIDRFLYQPPVQGQAFTHAHTCTRTHACISTVCLMALIDCFCTAINERFFINYVLEGDQ